MSEEKNIWVKLGDLYNKSIEYLDKLGLVNKEEYQIGDGVDKFNQVVFDPQSNLPKFYQWVLAMGAPLGIRNGEILNTFNAGITKGRADYLLSNSWGITNRDELNEQIGSLYNHGHRSNYDYLAEYYNQHGLENAIVELKKEFSDPEEFSAAIVYLKRIDEGRSLLIKDGLMTDEDRLPSFLAWDYGRIVSLMRWSVSSQIIAEEDFIVILKKIDIVTPVRDAYNSWREYANGYLLTRYVWGGDADEYVLWKKNMESLLAAPDSPWVTLPWSFK